MEKQFCFNYEHYAALEGLPDADRKLVAEAQRATENAHAPYSHFQVGAAARLRSGKILYGAISRARCIRPDFAPNVR